MHQIGDQRQNCRRRLLLAVALSLVSGVACVYLVGYYEWSPNSNGHHESLRSRRSIGNLTLDQKPHRRLPQAIIIGVKKGGTRALLEYLRMHPDVKAPGPEVHFFDRYYQLGSDWYRRQMPPTTFGQVAIEKTPSYFVTKEAPTRLRAFDPNVKLIVVLRNPVTRALSDYAQNAAKRPSMLNFEELAFINVTKAKNDSPSHCNGSKLEECDLKLMVNTSWGAIRIGLYHRYVSRWLKYFDLTRVHFVSGERLVTNPASETNAVERFLGLRQSIDEDHFVFPNSTGRFPCLRSKKGGKLPRCLGKTKGRRHPMVNDHLLRILRDFYQPHNEKLYKLIGRRFDW